MHLDLALGILLLKTDFFDLKDLAALPATLETFHLDFSWIALLYALGYEDRLRADKVFPDEETSENILATFTHAIAQTEVTDLPQPDFLDKQKIQIQSSVLGCTVLLEVPNQDQSLFLAEAILAALEAFLATSLDAPLLPYTPKLTIKILPTDFLSKPLEWEVSEERPLIEIRHPKDGTDWHAMHDILPDLTITITTRLAVPGDMAHFEKLFRDEQAMGRALCITNIGTTTGNILGKTPKLRLHNWTDENGEKFPLRRTEPWRPEQAIPRSKEAPPVFGTGDAPAELLDIEKLKHRDHKVISLIDIPLWNKAGWKGTGYVEHYDPHVPPLMALLFENKDTGTRIFKGWRQEIGPSDVESELRITIITGIDRTSPAHYRLIIAPNVDWENQSQGARVAVVSRIHTMTPSSSTNLDRFLNKYRKDQSYFLAPGFLPPGQVVPWAEGFDFDPDLAIVCSQLHVRPAWEIGDNDPDIVGIQEDDEVIIPEGVDNAPVLRTLERKKRRGQTPSGESSSPPVASQPKVGRNDACPCGSGKKFKKCHGR